MNIKSIPTAAGIGTVKEASEDQSSASGRESKSSKEESKKKSPEEKAATETQSPEAGDASLSSTQLVDSQTVIDLLSSRPTKPSAVKFPTLPTLKGDPASVKKLNRSA